MRKNNKQLYENIMKDVSKTIKNHLNELHFVYDNYYEPDTIYEIEKDYIFEDEDYVILFEVKAEFDYYGDVEIIRGFYYA